MKGQSDVLFSCDFEGKITLTGLAILMFTNFFQFTETNCTQNILKYTPCTGAEKVEKQLQVNINQ